MVSVTSIESGVDAVFLETPPYFFPQHVRTAVDAGCHVYVAKPVAVDVPGCLSIMESGRKTTDSGKVFLVDYQTRTNPFHIEAIRRVHQGALGKIGLTRTFYYDECFLDPWIAGDLPLSAMGYFCRNRADAQGDSHDCYAIAFQFKNGTVMTDHSEHVKNATGFGAGCLVYGQQGYAETNYAGKVSIRGTQQNNYPGGENKNLYADGMKSNVDTFHKSIVEGFTPT